MKNTKKRDKTELMYAHVESYLNSGHSLRTYAAQHGLTRSALDYWVRKRRGGSTLAPAKGPSPSFVQVGFDPGSCFGNTTNCQGTHRAGSPRAIFRFTGGLSIEVYA